jgi:bla regulator protein BlaR1
MISKYFSEAWVGIAPAVANHVWQSTLLLLAAWALTLPLRQHQARTRYWLWLVASLKFLVPFSLLVDLGVNLGTRLGAFTNASQASSAAQSGFSLIDYMSQPFAPTATHVPATATLQAAHSHPDLFPMLACGLAVVWLCGFVSVVTVWYLRWRRIASVVRQAHRLQERRELAILRKLEGAGGVRQPIEAVVSPTALEPGIFGIFRPVLVWPQGISEHLGDEHIQSILAHEICHVQRRDNLAAAAHMLVEAIFWFHPLVWWMGKRLLEERERACDEQALELGNEPKVYAESILKTCEFCVGSPLACVSGVSGADLKERIVRIMTNRGTRMLDLRWKMMLGAAGLLAVVVPLGLGLTHAQSAAAVPNANAANLPVAKFEVASIRPAASQDVHRVMMRVMDSPTDSRFYATNVTLKMLVRIAYGIQDAQIEGGPGWLGSDHYDIQAKADSSVDAELKKLPPDEAKLVKEHMLQELLADRFHLKIERQTKQMPVYALMVAKNGPKLQPAKAGDGIAGPNGKGPGAMMRIQQGGEMSFQMMSASMESLAQVLSQRLNRTVLDKTGLKGRYDFILHWTPDESEVPMMAAAPGMPPGGTGPTPTPDSSGPSIFTALQDQLGLKLKSEKGPVDALEIVSASQPTAN